MLRWWLWAQPLQWPQLTLTSPLAPQLCGHTLPTWLWKVSVGLNAFIFCQLLHWRALVCFTLPEAPQSLRWRIRFHSVHYPWPPLSLCPLPLALASSSCLQACLAVNSTTGAACMCYNPLPQPVVLLTSTRLLPRPPFNPQNAAHAHPPPY